MERYLRVGRACFFRRPLPPRRPAGYGGRAGRPRSNPGDAKEKAAPLAERGFVADVVRRQPFATDSSALGFSKNCSSSVEFLSAVVDAWLPWIVVVTASK